MRIVILAAGVGSRLGNPFPKPLTRLRDGRSIMERQLAELGQRFDPSAVSIVVGFKKEMIMEDFPDVSFIYNPYFGETNTSKSLLRALKLTGAEPNIAKLSMTRITRLAAELGLALQGPAGQLWKDEHADPVMAELALFAPAVSIYGGTDEVQKNIIGERVLGLPAEPRTDKNVPFRDIPR